METVLDRKRVKFYRDGGSRKITPPKAWLRRLGMADATEGDLVLTESGITLTAAAATPGPIEDEPGFARFLAFLRRTAIAHPETLTDAGDLYERDRDLVE